MSQWKTSSSRWKQAYKTLLRVCVEKMSRLMRAPCQTLSIFLGKIDSISAASGKDEDADRLERISKQIKSQVLNALARAATHARAPACFAYSLASDCAARLDYDEPTLTWPKIWNPIAGIKFTRCELETHKSASRRVAFEVCKRLNYLQWMTINICNILYYMCIYTRVCNRIRCDSSSDRQHNNSSKAASRPQSNSTPSVSHNFIALGLTSRLPTNQWFSMNLTN